MNEEEEFGMGRAGAFESDPIEAEEGTAVKDHPDFGFVDPERLRDAVSRRDDDPAGLAWLKHLPVEKDPMQWTFLEVQLRPDRAWTVIKELVGTICIGHGMMLAEETDESVLFRKKVAQDTMAHGMMNVATYQNLFVHIGVLPSKLRALHLGYVVTNDQKLLGGAVTTHLHGLTADRLRALNRSLDRLLAALQTTITSQFLSASYLYMTTPENTAEPGSGGDEIKLDDGYISDVRRMFTREMKANMRDLCIPLEEYAHNEEYTCALLLGLLDPYLKKYHLDVNSSNGEKETSAARPENEDRNDAGSNGAVALECPVAAAQANGGATGSTSNDMLPSGRLYGEIITDLVHELWKTHKEQCDEKVTRKIEEKKQQVTARVQAVQNLRVRALAAIVNHPEAEISTMKPSTKGNKDDVLLYEGTCVVNSIPVKLNITFGNLIYRTMVPLFARTTVVSFTDVDRIEQSTTLGIRVINVHLNPDYPLKCVTVAMGLEVDLLFQLLLEILAMHNANDMTRPVVSVCDAVGSDSENLAQFDTPNLDTLMDNEEEEKTPETKGSEDRVTVDQVAVDQSESSHEGVSQS